jgi:hypothetical protein
MRTKIDRVAGRGGDGSDVAGLETMGARATRKRGGGGGVRLFRAEDGRRRRRSMEEEEEGAGKVVEAQMTLAR